MVDYKVSWKKCKVWKHGSKRVATRLASSQMSCKTLLTNWKWSKARWKKVVWRIRRRGSNQESIEAVEGRDPRDGVADGSVESLTDAAARHRTATGIESKVSGRNRNIMPDGDDSDDDNWWFTTGSYVDATTSTGGDSHLDPLPSAIRVSWRIISSVLYSISVYSL